VAAKAQTVGVEQNEAGDYQLGVTIDGVFVPFVRKDYGYVQGIVSQGQQSKTTSSSSSSEEE
jgi:hypothetical protein